MSEGSQQPHRAVRASRARSTHNARRHACCRLTLRPSLPRVDALSITLSIFNKEMVGQKFQDFPAPVRTSAASCIQLGGSHSRWPLQSSYLG